MTLRRITSAALALVLAPVAAAVLAACGGAESYENRMAFLDKMTEAGITYRNELLKQGTAISQEACETGWDLLQADIPRDSDTVGVTKQWRAQAEEAYVKGCLTGSARPRPEPSGVDAVTPVPHGSAPGESGGPAPSGLPSGSP